MINILVLGDSHTKVFSYINKLKNNIFNFDVCTVGGATAQGILNPNSKSDAFNIYINKLNNTKINYDKIIIMLGEVDCGFLIWYRYDKYKIDIDEQINKSIENLFNFIKINLIEKKINNNQIIIAGSILPTIKDSTNKNILNGVRSEINVSQYDRTLKTLEYNKILYETAKKNNYNYIDITDNTINNGIIHEKFLSKDLHDHHLDDHMTYHLWINKLKLIL